MPSPNGCLGTALVGEKITINSVHVVVTKLLGEGMLSDHNKFGFHGNFRVSSHLVSLKEVSLMSI
jgi:hypothetical protein